MHVRARTVCLLALCWLGGATAAPSQVPHAATADSIGRALGALTARLDSIEAGTCPSGPAVAVPARTGEPQTDSLVGSLETLSRRLEAIRASRCPQRSRGTPAPAAVDTSGDLAASSAAAGRGLTARAMDLRLCEAA